MELSEFHNELLQNVRVRAQSASDFVRAAFVDEIGERLTAAEEFDNFETCRYEGTLGNKRLRVDGYALDEADNSLALMVANFSNDDELQSINADAPKTAFAHLRNFVEAAFKEKLTDGSIEESQPGYGLASDLINWHTKVSKYRFYFASNSELKMRAKDWPEENIDGIPTEFHIWDIARLHSAQISATGRDDLTVDFAEFDHKGLPCLLAAQSEGDYQAYLCMIPGKVLAGIYERYGSRLLEGNVRSFLSTRGKVNNKIIHTIKTEPEMFFAFNNGIAATAENVFIEKSEYGPRLMNATNLQIVNGGQTTASLAFASRTAGGKQDGADLSKIMVQMKLSVLPPEKAGILIPDIARYANSQNKVSDADFFANHAYHIRIEELSRRLFTPPGSGAQHGTHWFYERARGQYVNDQARLTAAEKRKFELQNPKLQLLTKTDLAKFEITWRRLPHKVSMGAQKNFLLFAELITDDWKKDELKFNEDYFRDLIALAILFKRTETLVREQAWYQGGYRANVVTYTLAKLHEMIAEQALEYQMDLRGIWDKQAVPAVMLEQIAIIAKRVFDILTDPKRPKDNVTEWAKMQACWDQVKATKIPLQTGVMASLRSLNEVTSAAKAAKETRKMDSGIEIQSAVVGIPASKWQAALTWASSEKLLTDAESALLRIATQMPRKLPTEKQCSQIWHLYTRLLEQGCPK